MLNQLSLGTLLGFRGVDRFCNKNNWQDFFLNFLFDDCYYKDSIDNIKGVLYA